MDGANNAVLHNLNMNSIFRLIQHQGPISRVDIAERTGLAASTVSMITGELHDSKFIRECGYATSTGGRRPRLVEVNPEGGYFVCVDLAGSEIAIGVLSLSFTVVQEWFYKKSNVSGEHLYQEIVRTIAEVLEWCQRQEFRVLSIGVAAPGLMDTSTGRILEASNLNWHDLNLDALLEREFQLPTIVENDTNAAAYGEFLYGLDQAEHVRNILYIAIGTGVGAGLIIDGLLYKGSQGMAGEIGHTIVVQDGQLCSCGKRGCLETVISESAILRDYNDRTGGEAATSAEEVVQRAEAGDTTAIEVLLDAGHILGLAVGNQMNILNMDTVVFGGEVLSRDGLMLTAVKEGMKSALLPGFDRNLQVRLSSLGSRAGYIGIAYSSLTSVLNKYGFNQPELLQRRKQRSR